MQAQLIRSITKTLPIPGKFTRKIIEAFDTFIIYPENPVIIQTKIGKFEIRNPREYIQRNIFFFNYYEIRETRLIKHILRPKDTFVDIGANVGWFTLCAANIVGDDGKVFAFEPSSFIHDHLSQNITINSLSNVSISKVALSDEKGNAHLVGIDNTNNGTGSIAIKNNDQQDSNSELVKTEKFDNYNFGSNRIRLIKIDVEGAEIQVLKGMSQILKDKKCDYIMIEVSDPNLRKAGSSSEELIYFLQEYNCQFFQIGLMGIKPFKASYQGLNTNLLVKMV